MATDAKANPAATLEQAQEAQGPLAPSSLGASPPFRGAAAQIALVEYRADPVSKLGLLLCLLPTHLGEFRDRLQNFFEVRYERMRVRPNTQSMIGLDEAIALLNKSFQWNLTEVLREKTLERVESDLGDLILGARLNGPFTASHNADLELARFCYAASRVLSPKIVVETGVAYGVTTRFVLQALAQNKQGRLYSLDLPPLTPNADRFTGLFVPGAVREMWTLHRGASRRHLHKLLERLGSVDLFIHDSLHTYANMYWEFQAVWPYLQPGGILIADDVDGHCAFSDFAARVSTSFSAIVAEKSKKAAFGVLVKSR